MTAPRCRHCYQPSTVVVFGQYRNGRSASDYACPRHAPITPDDIGVWWSGYRNRQFRISAIEPVLL